MLSSRRNYYGGYDAAEQPIDRRRRRRRVSFFVDARLLQLRPCETRFPCPAVKAAKLVPKT